MGLYDDVVICIVKYTHSDDTAMTLQCFCKGYAEVLQLVKIICIQLIKCKKLWFMVSCFECFETSSKQEYT